MSTYNFDKMTRIGDFETHLCTDKLYGCFEDVVDGGEGGLWFEYNNQGKLAICDYDGYFALPEPVIQALIQFGCDVSYVIDEDDDAEQMRKDEGKWEDNGCV